MPCSLQIGEPDPSGQVAARVNLSVGQEKEKGTRTSDTSGQRGLISSASANLQQSLENRLRQKMHSSGLILFRLTWKARTTPLGRRICALRASRLHISDNDYSSWPTPMAGTPASENYNEAGNTDSSRKTV